MTKCKCGRKPVYFRRYEGHYYCKCCFLSMIEKKFNKTVGKYRLVQNGDHIVVGLSGGKDSSTALYLMNRLLQKRENVSLTAVSIDEGIGTYRPKTLELAKKLCKDLEVPHKLYSFQKEFGKPLDKKIKGSKDACTFCGVGRRYLLNKASRELGATKLCVGHNLDDEAQSVLMNLLRGDLLRAGRMGTITENPAPKGFIPRIKPLRFIPEKETALYAILRGLPSPGSECPNLGGLRPEIRVFLNEMEQKRAGTKFALLESFDKLSPFVQKAVQYKGPLTKCKKCKEPSSKEVCKTCELWKSA
ncbi:MAG: TIGR00269 family protein [Candidatus Aenigmarchaeota archaeon]|nr:TIGR00269 family protein [Candidatus Aenigmarchaeota archaeon]